MGELLPNSLLASFIYKKSWRLMIDGTAPIARVFITQLDSLQDDSSYHDKSYIIHHLVFLLKTFHHEQLQVQVPLILGWFPQHIGLLSTILGLTEFT